MCLTYAQISIMLSNSPCQYLNFIDGKTGYRISNQQMSESEWLPTTSLFSFHWIIVEFSSWVMDHKRNILSCAKPLLYLSKISGLCLFVIRDNFNVHVSPLDILLILCHISVSGLVNLYYWKPFFGAKEFAPEVLQIFFPSYTFVTFIIICFLKIYNFRCRMWISKFLKTMQDIDEDLGVLGVKFDYENHRRFVIKLIFAIIIHHAIVMCLYALLSMFYDWRLRPLASLFILYTFSSIQTSVTIFLCAVFGLCERIKAFNTVLRYEFHLIILFSKLVQSVSLPQTQQNHNFDIEWTCQSSPKTFRLCEFN